MQHDFLLQRTGHEHVDVFSRERGQNSLGWIALFIMDRRIGWKLQFCENVTKSPRRLLISPANIDQMKFRPKAVADPLRFSKNVLEPGRTRSRNSNGLVRR